MLPIQEVIALGRMVWNRKPITICISLVAPMMPLKQMWKPHNLLDDRYSYDKDNLYELHNIVLDKY